MDLVLLSRGMDPMLLALADVGVSTSIAGQLQHRQCRSDIIQKLMVLRIVALLVISLFWEANLRDVGERVSAKLSQVGGQGELNLHSAVRLLDRTDC